MKKYFRIGEISRLYHIGVDSLRYYERIGIIRPERAESGYRLYSMDDIWRLNVIRDLRELGFGLDTIGDYLDTHTVDSTLALLEEERQAIERKLTRLRGLQENVETRMQILRSAESRSMNRIERRTFPARKCFFIREGYSEEHEMDVLIKRLLNLDPQHLYVIGNNQIGTVISLRDAGESGRLTYEAVFIVDDKGTDILTGGTYLTVSYRGDYRNSTYWAGELLKEARTHHLTPAGDFLEWLWVDIHTTEREEEYVTELQLPVREEAAETPEDVP